MKVLNYNSLTRPFTVSNYNSLTKPLTLNSSFDRKISRGTSRRFYYKKKSGKLGSSKTPVKRPSNKMSMELKIKLLSLIANIRANYSGRTCSDLLKCHLLLYALKYYSNNIVCVLFFSSSKQDHTLVILKYTTIHLAQHFRVKTFSYIND